MLKNDLFTKTGSGQTWEKLRKRGRPFFAQGMMCSFNSIRGVPACANHRAMQTWAKGQWKFPGYIVSDQGAAMGILTDHKCAYMSSESFNLPLHQLPRSSAPLFGSIYDILFFR
jgi:hypothetical protein